MSNSPVLPINDASPDDAVNQTNELPEDYNFADDEDSKAFFTNEVLAIVKFITTNRVALSEKWAENRRMDYMVFDENQNYRGRSNAYIPAWAKVNKTLISQMSSGLFPTDEYLDCSAMNGATDEEAAMMKAYAQYEFGEVAKLPYVIKPFLREMNNAGTAVLKYGWNQQRQGSLKRSKLDVIEPDNEHPTYNEGLYVSARSIHNVFVYPVEAEHPRELQLIAEVVQIPNSFVLKMGRLKRWKNTEFAINNRAEMNAILEKARLIGEKDNLSPDTLGPVTQTLGMTHVCEIYTYMRLPKRAYLPGEDTDELLPVQIFCVGSVPLSIRRNPFFHQCMPYLFGRDNVHAGSFYGIGTASMVKSLQQLVNDFSNQANDASNYALNPIIKLNPTFIVGTPPRLRPGVVWKMTDIDQGVKFDRPPPELITAGQSVMSYWQGAVADFGGAPPVLQGKSGSGGAKTATGSQILQRNALQPLQDTIEDLEGDVFVPLMKRLQSLARQFQKRDVGLLVSGSSKTVSPDIFDREYAFRWLASSQMVNQQMRAQQVLTLIQAAAPMIPYLMQLGYKFDPVPLFKKAYYDGMGFREFDKIFQRGMPPQVGLPQPGQPQPPGAQQAQSPAQPQVSGFPGGPQVDNPVPGEGDELTAVKTPMEELSSVLGSLGGNGSMQ